MNNVAQSFIRTANKVSIRRQYLKDVIFPVIDEFSQAMNPIVKYYSISGRNICVKFYSEKLAELYSHGIAHSELSEPLDNEDVDLTIIAWDTNFTNAEFQSPCESTDHYHEQITDTKNSYDEGFIGTYLKWDKLLIMLDSENKVGYLWTLDAGELPPWVIAEPFRNLLSWDLSNADTHIIHAAAVALDNNAVLISSKSGTGKSTTSLSCLFSGLDYLGDDYVGVEIGDDIVVHSLYNTVKVSSDHMDKFEVLKEHVWKNVEGKNIVFLSSLFPKQMIRSSILKAILIPVIKHSKKTIITPASKLEAIFAIAPTSIGQLPLVHTSKLNRIREIVMNKPCYFLEMSEDREEVAATIREFLKTNDQ